MRITAGAKRRAMAQQANMATARDEVDAEFHARIDRLIEKGKAVEVVVGIYQSDHGYYRARVFVDGTVQRWWYRPVWCQSAWYSGRPHWEVA